jgi:hypothetical protein
MSIGFDDDSAEFNRALDRIFSGGGTMAKVAEDAALELPLNDERKPEKKVARHVAVALRHLNAQRDKLAEKIASDQSELDSLDASIAALSPE